MKLNITLTTKGKGKPQCEHSIDLYAKDLLPSIKKKMEELEYLELGEKIVNFWIDKIEVRPE